MKNIMILCGFFLCVQACGILTDKKKSIDYLEVLPLSGNKEISFQKKEYKIKWGDSISYTKRGYDIVNINNEPYLVALNENNGDLIGFNINSQELVFKIPKTTLPISRTNGEVSSVHVHNFDSIFIIQTYQFHLIDTSGIVKHQADINKGDDKYAFGNIHSDFPVFYDNKTDKLYTQTYYWKRKQHDRLYYTSPIESSINVSTNDIERLPVYYSKLYQKYYYGYANHVYRSFTDSLNIYTFPVDPNIYVYNRYAGNYKVIGGKSKYQRQPVRTLSRKQKDDDKTKINHFSTIPFYYKVHYNPFQNYYYRFFSPALPQKNEEGLFNKYSDREHILMIFDEQFRLIDEIELEEKYQVLFTFCTSEGLHVNRVNEQKEQGLYTIFKIDIQ